MKKPLLLVAFLILLQPLQTLAKTYNLEIKKEDVFITEKAVKAMTINGQIPAPTLRFTEGEEAIINVKNSMDETTSLHWHGILLPGDMDGVPGLNGFDGIKPGETFTYRFKIRQNGTYWYHSHSNLQEQQGLYGALIIDPKNASQINPDYEIVLSDFSEEDPNQILNNLKSNSAYYNKGQRTISDFFVDVKRDGFFATLRNRSMWNEMRMQQSDLADVSNYHFLINGKTSKQNWTGIFKKGQKVRLRFINASAMTFFDISIPGLKMTVVAADGQEVKPFKIDEFRIGIAETYDVIVEPTTEKAYTIFAESLDRSGYARGTIVATSSPSAQKRDDLSLNRGNDTAKQGMQGEIPKMRPRTLLTMADMRMEGMHHENMASGWADMSTPKGHRALKYEDLISLKPQKDLRKPIKDIEFRFGGNMERYIWTINGEKFPKPFHLKYGDRVRLIFTNDTMMAHPVHLHGMFMQLENGQDAKWMPNKHTVIIPPAKSISVLLTANEEGEWAFHCHLLYHMATGMMTSVNVDRK